ncbi:MAG TPA: alpha/beta fold hydrolase, partial [Terriglobia bacterium]|nr:alpha/beta fold hydrolase [Terriglobia bacterium]
VRGQGRIRFDGLLSGNLIRGQAEQNGVVGEFQMVRIDRSQPNREPRLAATYRARGGAVITVARFDFGDGIDRLALLDAERGYWGTLIPTAPDAYVLAPARSGRFPVNLRVEFQRYPDGNGRTLTLTGPASERVTANRVDVYDARDVVFQNGDIKLSGTILSPRGQGTSSAVVMVHSSGNQSQNGPVAYFRLIANVFAANGITTLVYDKRGVASSTGSWTTASFDDLAGDVRAAVATVRSTPGVDPDRVGIWGISQGGWVGPLAATGDSRVAFLALVGSAATTPAQQEMDRVAQVMKANGSAQTDIDAAQRYLQTFFEVVSGLRPWDALQAAITSTASERWLQYTPRPRTPQEASWSPAPAMLDPASVFQKIQAPVLAIHGTDDLDVPASRNSALFAKLSTHSLSRRRVFDRADHYILVGIENPDTQYRRLSSGYLDLMMDWIKRASRDR